MPGGRPLKFPSVEGLEIAIEAFFVQCEEDRQPITITGLALALDTSRETLCEYQVRPEFVDTIKRAKLRCENFAEKQLYLAKSPAGPIFALKNYGWKDTQGLEHSGSLVQVQVEAEKLAQLPQADLDAAIEMAEKLAAALAK